jgi:hypothetical protein
MVHGGLGIGLIVDIHSLFPYDILIITNSPLPQKENGGHPCVSADVSSSSILVPLNKMLSNDGIDNFLYAALCKDSRNFYGYSSQGILTNETKCLRCETVTARDETFFDLSLDIEQNSSITSCLKNFSSTETLNAEDKFFCDKCCR